MKTSTLFFLLILSFQLLGQGYLNQKGDKSSSFHINYNPDRIPRFILEYTLSTKSGFDFRPKIGYSNQDFFQTLNVGLASDYYLARQESFPVNWSIGAGYEFTRFSGFGDSNTFSTGSIRTEFSHRIETNGFYIIPLSSYEHQFFLGEFGGNGGLWQFGANFSYAVDYGQLISFIPTVLYFTQGGDPSFQFKLGYLFGRTNQELTIEE